jgi:hypothetical protein
MNCIKLEADLRVRPSFRAGAWVGPYECFISKKNWDKIRQPQKAMVHSDFLVGIAKNYHFF